MGNSDGLTSAILSQGTNGVINFEGGYFSFAFGNEIALVLKEKPGYYILNCGSELFEKVKEKVESEMTEKELITWWKEQSKNYEQSDWSADFDDL